ncbi:STAS domain-containing protein [Siminovitchia acidinfaciens]|uniref:STAS domain-containing protein n=1 Tax=Siminovitchia acidinfaciens TaxID=2321395 RepID=A0A429Y7W7_9BACI|nr:SulP family inorganic anion transporter [Siminovitchia acidinfaciens]RST77414.1 STAS domain-containing protein [Siminovitchia acidinfaciens]
MFADDRFRDYQPASLRKDFISGITVGIVAIPLGMAFAMASGVKPEYGIYTTIIAGLIVSLLGGSRYQIAGPTGAFIPILLAVVLQYGYEDLLIAGLMAGVMLVAMSFFKLGSLVHFIPRSVTIGFTTGIAVIIFSGQLGNFFGLDLESHEYFHQNMAEFFSHLGAMNIYSILTAAVGLLVIILVPKFFPRVPVLLVGLIIPTIFAALLFPGHVETVGSAYGGIPQSLPKLQFPDITLAKIGTLLTPALVIAALGAIESLLSAVVADGMTGDRHKSNRELFGQGIANIVAPLFGGIPATGAIARTATNIKSGAVSPMSGVIHSVFVLLTLLLFAPYASYIPLAAMAPLLMLVAWNMSGYKAFKQILQLRTGDSLVLAVTFLLTVFINLTVAVQVGLLLAVLSFVKKKSEQLQIDDPDNTQRQRQESLDLTAHFQIKKFTIRGPLFFGTAQSFEHSLMASIRRMPRVILLDMQYVTVIDATGEDKLALIIDNIKKAGSTVLVSGLPDWGIDLFKKSGLYEKIGASSFFPDEASARDSLFHKEETVESAAGESFQRRKKSAE